MVIVVIGVLAALLLPAIQSAIRTARDAGCTAEIESMAQALESFKTRYGDYPPSRVVLNETLAFSNYPTGSTAPLNANSITWLSGGPNFQPYGGATSTPNATAPLADLTFGQLATRTVSIMRKFFPRAGVPDLVGIGPNGPDPALRAFHDYNGNGRPDQGWILLEGHECLAFFLGGLPSGSGTGLVGFAKDNQWPFKGDAAVPNPQFPSMTSANRQPPFFEFKAGRLVDADGDGIPAYLDPLGAGTEARAYVYFSAYGSNNYDPNDVNIPETDPRVQGPLARPFRSGPRLNIPSPAPNPYTASIPIPLGAGNCPDTTDPRPTSWERAQSYQIVSAGTDGFYGVGGQRDTSPGAAALLPIPDAACTNLDLDATIRDLENDNLANFASGRLGR